MIVTRINAAYSINENVFYSQSAASCILSTKFTATFPSPNDLIVCNCLDVAFGREDFGSYSTRKLPDILILMGPTPLPPPPYAVLSSKRGAPFR
jgi:hypothetical protein